MRYLSQQPHRLQCVEPEITADSLVVIFRFHSVVAQLAHSARKGVAVCQNHSAVAKPAQILRGEKAQTRSVSKIADFNAVARCAYRLRPVLYHS